MGAILAGLIRHAVGMLGGVLVAKGLGDQNTATELVGALTTLAMTGWSIWEKYQAQKAK